MNAQEHLKRILDRARECGLSTAALCRAAGVSPALASRWKSGAVEPRLSSLCRLESALERIAKVPA